MSSPLYQTAGGSFPIVWTVPITWTGTPAASYDVQYRDGPSGAWTDVVTSTTSTFANFSGQEGHTYYFRARSHTATGAIGDWSEPVSTTVDLTPPTGNLAVQGWSSPYISNTATLSVSASDATSGLSQMQLGSDGQTFNPWEPYGTASLYLASPGATAVYGRFKDNAGNVSQPVSATIALDDVSPTGSVSINGGATYATSMTATLALSATDSLSGGSNMALSNDGTAWNGWEGYSTSKSWPLASGPDGPRTAYARFRDAARNVSPVYSDTIILDTAAPTGTVVINGGALDTNSTAVTLTLAAGDALSGVSQMSFSNVFSSMTAWRGLASQLLLNGGFEEGGAAPDYWQSYGGSLARVSYPRNSGSYSAALTSASAPAKWMYQTVAVSGGNPYTLSGYVLKNDAQVASAFLRIAFYASTDGAGQQPLSDVRSTELTTDSPEFRLLTIGPVVAPVQARSARVMGVLQPLSTVEATVYFDDFSLEGEVVYTPTPTNDGQTYSPWEDYAPARSWSIPGGNGTKTVYARFRDNAGNVSQPYTDAIVLNTTAPSSAVSPLSLYQSTTAFTVTWSGTALGSGVVAAYDLQYKDGAAGQWTDWITSTLSTSAVFTGTEGHTYYFQSRARDLAGNVEPYVGGDGHTRTTVDLTPPTGSLSINGGALDTTARTVTLGLSASDSLSGVAQASYSDDEYVWSGWETYAATRSWTLPTGEGEKTVWARFRDAAGNISATVSDTIRLDTSVAPTYGFSVNEGALFTNRITVTLSLPANPSTAQMMLSNDGGFYGAAWEPYAAYRPWAITQYGSYVIARTVYVKFKDVTGNVYGPMSDEIILDVNAPTGSVSIEGAGAAERVESRGPRVQAPMPHASAWGGVSAPLPHGPLSVNGEGVGGEVARAAATPVTLSLSASDVESGVGGMMVSNSPAFSGASWEPFSATRSWNMESGGKVYVAFKDNAGNASPIYAASLSGAKESLPALALGTVHPKTGGTVASSEAGTTVSFPPGAVGAKTEVTLVPAVESNLQASMGALKSTGKFLTLTARAGETPITTVSQPYTVTVGYTAGDAVGIDESTLAVYWWNGSAWQKEPGSRVDTEARTVSAAINHLSAFAVLGESSTRTVYLPLVIKSYGAGW